MGAQRSTLTLEFLWFGFGVRVIYEHQVDGLYQSSGTTQMFIQSSWRIILQNATSRTMIVNGLIHWLRVQMRQLTTVYTSRDHLRFTWMLRSLSLDVALRA